MLKIKEKHSAIISFILATVIIFSICSKKDSTSPNEETEKIRKLVILYTNDEHGWMEVSDPYGGAAGMMGLWKENENYSEDGPYLILSGGDMWTGPAISTWTKGESMVDVMNAMDYTAAAIGNHEFDFKIDELKKRITESEFVYLSANIREKATGEIPDFATPSVIIEKNGIKIGIVGITTRTTPNSTFPDHVKDYDFIDYETALTGAVPELRESGAELIIVIGHTCRSENRALCPLAAELGISIIGGGHCHQAYIEQLAEVTVMESGSYMRNYAKLDLMFDTEGDTLVSISGSINENIGGNPDQDIQTIVDYWKSETDATLSEVIGYTSQEIGSRTHGMYNMVTDSWLISYPNADISCTNIGGIRQSIPAGEITVGTIVGVLPFENNIIELELTGSQVIEQTANLIVGGMTRIGGYNLANGTPIESGQIYHVLTTDYLYSRSDYNFSIYDPEPYYTSYLYRQPVIDWITSLNTSAGNSLHQHLDNTARTTP
ncbi:hypothetical protein B6I21_06790 [candidate division KSB1 bacterium 4572_119]|nr:MAG: hypothetical protein B6I21_06790 [candidate division KSB1 bacterium 4572_119]